MNALRLPMRAGRTSPQAHADLPSGAYERELGQEGFSGPATHMYHQHAPTAWIRWEGPLRPRAFDLQRLGASLSCPFEGPTIASNAHLRLRCWQTSEPMRHLVRNADGDDLLFVHAGGGDFYCDFGHLQLREGDYVVLPRGTTWRLDPSASSFLLLLEATGSHYSLPDKGLLGAHALFDPGVLTVPKLDDAFRAQQEDDGDWSIRIKARQQISTLTYPHNPLDAIGWKGTLAPVRVNWRDFRPLNSHRYHLPPSAHTTFVAERFVVCTFVPRPAETDPGALKVPFFHSNDDYDELLFLHAGKFFSREGMGPGVMTYHPGGFPHGPHPGAYQASLEAPRTFLDEVAINIDARDPLVLVDALSGCELESHASSWKGFLGEDQRARVVEKV